MVLEAPARAYLKTCEKNIYTNERVRCVLGVVSAGDATLLRREHLHVYKRVFFFFIICSTEL